MWSRVRRITSAHGAFYVKLACRAVTRCRPTPEEHIPSGLDRVRVGLLSLAIVKGLECSYKLPEGPVMSLLTPRRFPSNDQGKWFS